MREGDFLLVRGASSVWAVPSAAVSTIERHCGRLALLGGERALQAEEVLSLARRLPLHPPGRLLMRLCPYPCRGLVVFDGLPVVVVDPAKPPPDLCGEEGEPRNVQ